MHEVRATSKAARNLAGTCPTLRWGRRVGASGHGSFFVALALSIALSGCGGGGGGDADPKPSLASTPSTVAPKASRSWESAFSADELIAYRAAMNQYAAYLKESEPIWAAGDATPQALSLLRKYYIPWQAYWEQLKGFDRSRIRISRNAEVLDSRATRVQLDGEDATVAIQQCVDATNIGATQDGKPLANAFDTPQLIDIEMSRVGGRWYITQPPTDPKDRPCDA